MIKVIGITKENKSILMSYAWAHTFIEVKQNSDRISDYEYQLYDEPDDILKENGLEPTGEAYRPKHISILLPDGKYYQLKKILEVKEKDGTGD